jgi:glycosyltransferase involved in cell wall biosynthesis
MASMLGGELAALPALGYGAALGVGGRWTVRLTLRLADLVTAPTSAGLAAIEAMGHRARTAAMPLGVDTALFRPPDDPGSRRDDQLLFTGALAPVKNPGLVVRAAAAAMATRPGLRLVVAGDGPLRRDVAEACRLLGIGDRVELAGDVPRPALAERYRRATALVIGSWHEGQSMVAVEAAASGLPIVGTRVGVLGDLGAAARTVDVGDEPGLAAALAAVLDDAELRARMAAAGRVVARSRYALETCVEGVLDAYRSLSAGSRR